MRIPVLTVPPAAKDGNESGRAAVVHPAARLPGGLKPSGCTYGPCIEGFRDVQCCGAQGCTSQVVVCRR